MIDVNHLCPGCMKPWEDPAQPCGNCGFSFEKAVVGRELPTFSIIAGRYLLGTKIGAGGFGIIYIAMDLVEEKVVAIKEFFPASLASREGSLVRALPGEDGRSFRQALRSFRREAELMARFREVEGIVACRDFVEENDTAYLVMDYVEGPNLKQYMRQTGKTFTQAEALELMRPILLAAEAMHRQNVLHRDISPENLILKPDHTLTLIDFGAAREYDLEEDENLTVILKHGYAPEEQYHFGSRQGPWTDLYACCAVLYQMVSGILPQDAAGRTQRDMVLPLDEIDGVVVTRGFARVIEKGMTVHATERYPSIRALLKDLYPDGAAAQNKAGEVFAAASGAAAGNMAGGADMAGGDSGAAQSDEPTIAMAGVSAQPDDAEGAMGTASTADFAPDSGAVGNSEAVANVSGNSSAAKGKSGRTPGMTAVLAAVTVVVALASGCISAVTIFPSLMGRFGLAPWFASVAAALVGALAAAVLSYVFFHSAKWTAITGIGALIVDWVLASAMIGVPVFPWIGSGNSKAQASASVDWPYPLDYANVQEDSTVWLPVASQSYSYGDHGQETFGWQKNSDDTMEYEFTENGLTVDGYYSYYNWQDWSYNIDKYVFDADGILLLEENNGQTIYEAQRDGDTVTFTEMDSDGNIYMKGSIEYSDRMPIHKTAESYDENGQIYATYDYTCKYEDGKILWSEERETEGDAVRTAQTQYEYDPVSGKVSYRYKEEKDDDGSYLKYEMTYKYDEYGNIVMRRAVQDSYDASTGAESTDIITEDTYAYGYDSQGNIVSQEWYTGGDLIYTSVYTYDAYGNYSVIMEYSEDFEESVIVYEYDTMGNRLTEARYTEEGRCSFNNCVYAEYALEDGIFVPTGQTSGSQDATLPSPTYDGGGSSSEARIAPAELYLAYQGYWGEITGRRGEA